jgi:hypothetical protein
VNPNSHYFYYPLILHLLISNKHKGLLNIILGHSPWHGTCNIRRPGETIMRSFLINKNLCFCYWLRKRIGKKRALWVTGTIEKVILVFGRDAMPIKGV